MFTIRLSPVLLASLTAGLISIFLIQCSWAGPIVVDGDVSIERNIEIETVVSGLVHPWGMAWLPDGDLLVTERPGRLRLVRMSPDGAGRLESEPLAGVPQVFAGGQGGLLDISLPCGEDGKPISSPAAQVGESLFPGVAMDAHCKDRFLELWPREYSALSALVQQTVVRGQFPIVGCFSGGTVLSRTELTTHKRDFSGKVNPGQ